jgi:ElaA protein
MPSFRARILPFDALTGAEVYALLALRQRVFVVEQDCAYLDADGLDADAAHVLIDDGESLRAYLRVLRPGVRFDTVTLGRVVVDPAHRGVQLGRRVMEEALAHVARTHGPVPVSLSAQAHLVAFYGSLGFAPTSGVYDEDGIAHIDMRRAPDRG